MKIHLVSYPMGELNPRNPHHSDTHIFLSGAERVDPPYLNCAGYISIFGPWLASCPPLGFSAVSNVRFLTRFHTKPFRIAFRISSPRFLISELGLITVTFSERTSWGCTSHDYYRPAIAEFARDVARARGNNANPASHIDSPLRMGHWNP